MNIAVTKPTITATIAGLATTFALGAPSNAAGSPASPATLLARHVVIGEFFSSPSNGWAVLKPASVVRGRGLAILLHTDNGGQAWKQQLATPLVNMTEADFESFGDGRIVLTSAVAPRLVYRTTNNGRSWVTYRLPPSTQSVTFPTPAVGWALTGGGAAAGAGWTTIRRTTNGGRTWTMVDAAWPAEPQQLGGGSGDPDQIFFRTATAGWILGSMNLAGATFLFRFPNGFRGWERQTLRPLPASARRAQLALSPPQFVTARDGFLPVYASSVGLYVASTTNGGTTWSRAFAVPDPTGEPGLVRFLSPQYGEAAIGHEIYATTDGGKSWSRRGSLPYAITALQFVTDARGYAIAGGRLYVTDTGGTTWSPV